MAGYLSPVGQVSRSGPLPLVVLWYGNGILHTIPQQPGHFAFSAPCLGQKRRKHAGHVTSAFRGPSMILYIFILNSFCGTPSPLPFYSLSTGQGSAFHMSRLYSMIVLSDENLPILATFNIAFLVHAS